MTTLHTGYIQKIKILGIKKEAGISPRLSRHRNAYRHKAQHFPNITLVS